MQVQPGQSRSGQAGSECCHSPGNWRVRSVHSEETGHEGSAPKSSSCDADAVSRAEGSIRTTVIARLLPGSPESPAQGMLSQRLPVNPGELPVSSRIWGVVHPDDKRTGSAVAAEGRRQKRTTSDAEVTCRQGRPEVAATGRRAVLRTHITCEGGEPQGSRKGRPWHPLEGRGKQVDESMRGYMSETQNSENHVKWT